MAFEVWATMDPRLALRDVPAHARRAESLGYTGLQVLEAVHDGLLAAALALEHTRTLRVATSVLVAFPRSPMVVAHAAWDLAALSCGRFELGLGSQVRGNVEERYGVAWAPPVPRMREYVGALRAIWRSWQDGAPLAFAGEHYRLGRMQPFFAPDPIASGPPRVALGAVGPAMTRLAGEVADTLVTHPTQACATLLHARVAPAVAEGERRAGRAAGACAIVAGGFVATGPDEAAVRAERERIRGYLGFLYSTPQYAPALAALGAPELGGELRALARAGRWAELPSRIPDEILGAVAPAARYPEIADVLRGRWGTVCAGLSFPMPADPAGDEGARAAIAALRA